MTTPSPGRHIAWLRTKMSAAVLISLLQRTPATRLVHTATEIVAASPVGAVLKAVAANQRYSWGPDAVIREVKARHR